VRRLLMMVTINAPLHPETEGRFDDERFGPVSEADGASLPHP
jgi:hypothetical protein